MPDRKHLSTTSAIGFTEFLNKTAVFLIADKEMTRLELTPHHPHIRTPPT